jgi:Domain of unknown function (DUF4835)
LFDYIEIHILSQPKKQKILKKMKILFLFLFTFSSLTFSQELNCKVTLNTENISIAGRDKLKNFGQVIEDYMNKTHFTSDWQGGKINCSMSVFVLSYSNEINYSAQVVVTSLRPIYKTQDNSLVLSINDNTWSFTYDEGQSLRHDLTVFDPLTGFLDYYANVIIGFYIDSWEKLGGTPYFSKAFDMVNLGASSSFSGGWLKTSGSYNRRGLVEDLLSDKFRPFRESIYDYYLGLDNYKEYPKQAMDYMVRIVTTLQNLKTKMDLNTVLTKVFFDAKSGEIVERLKNYPDKEKVFSALTKIDPAHASKYNEQLPN